jgi:hypothetical protein
MEANKELTFWVCYKRDKATGRYNYFGDGKGHIRLFKTQQAIKEGIGFPELSIEEIEARGFYIHSIQGLFAIPEPEEEPKIRPDAIRLLTPQDALPPSAAEILANWKKKRKRMA